MQQKRELMVGVSKEINQNAAETDKMIENIEYCYILREKFKDTI